MLIKINGFLITKETNFDKAWDKFLEEIEKAGFLFYGISEEEQEGEEGQSE